MKRIFHFFDYFQKTIMLPRAFYFPKERKQSNLIIQQWNSIQVQVCPFQLPFSARKRVCKRQKVLNDLETCLWPVRWSWSLNREESECHSRGRKYGSRVHGEVSIVKGWTFERSAIHHPVKTSCDGLSVWFL